eukprot:TRINITY_DN8971_c0_g1_i1.p1 TRINITY_DN8971_c0_g1~~TRINITY_DN8971_c0_g1_i1.p1  ORF type:complete len:357 (-),score=51.18 TRINITY_DN8971_c0_g1_i1:208-1278(-)
MYNQLKANASTTMVREYSRADGDPYYPVPNEQNRQLYAKYQALAQEEESEHNVHFVGRLANYKYFNMDAAFRNAIDHFVRLHPKFTEEDTVFQPGRSLKAATAMFEPSRTEHPSLDLVLSACARDSGIPSSTWTASMRSVVAPFCDTPGHQHRVFVYTCNDITESPMEELMNTDPQLNQCEWHFQPMPQVSMPAAQLWLLHLLSRQFWFSHVSVFLSVGGVFAGGWEPSFPSAMQTVQRSVMADPRGGFDAPSMRTFSMRKQGHAVFLARKSGATEPEGLADVWAREHGGACRMPAQPKGEFVATEAAIRRMLARHRGKLLAFQRRFEDAQSQTELYLVAEVLNRSWCLLFDECDC